MRRNRLLQRTLDRLGLAGPRNRNDQFRNANQCRNGECESSLGNFFRALKPTLRHLLLSALFIKDHHLNRLRVVEFCLGRIVDESRSEYVRITAQLVEQGARAIILGCTEISLLVGAQDSAVPLFDTTDIHARQAAEWALAAS